MTTKLSRERVVIIGILGVALGGLAIDRVFLSSSVTGPAQVAASDAEFAMDDLLDQVDVEPVQIVDEPQSVTSALADRLEEFAQSRGDDIENLPDVFQPPTSWLGDSATAETAYRATTPAGDFLANHRLNAVMLSRSKPGAVVNKQFITIGQAVDGFVLVSVSERSAVFEADGEQAELELDGPSDQP